MARRNIPEGLEEMAKYEGQIERREIEDTFDEIVAEAKQTNMNRRTLLKAFAGGGGLATLNALFAQKKFMGDDLESGLMAIQQSSGSVMGVREVDEPPYDVDDSYERFDGSKKVFRIDDAYGEPSGNIGPPETSESGTMNQIERGWAGRGSATIGNMPPVEMSSSGEARALWALSDSRVRPGNYGGEPIRDGTFREIHGFDDNPMANREPDMTDPAQLRKRLYQTARIYGVSDLGVSDVDPRWVYSHSDAGVPIELNADVEYLTVDGEGDDAVYKIPERVNRSIAIAVEMPLPWGRTGSTLGGGICSNLGYEAQGYALTAVGKWIELMGYHAIPMGNHGLAGPAVPAAIDAGLGEQGRHARLIHPQYGSNIRVSRILTDMPLETDSWIEFGAQEFCKACKICATQCPAGAIPTATERGREWGDFWPGNGYFKTTGNLHWVNNGARCRKFWRENGTNDSQCVSMCPFSQGRSWLHDVIRAAAGTSAATDAQLAAMSETFGYEKLRHPEDVWDREWLMWGRTQDPALGKF